MLLLALAAPAAAQLPVPPLAGRVNDRADMLSPAVEAELERKLRDYETETSHQLVVLTIPSLEGEAVESFARRVFDTWKPGHAGLDNGLLLVVAARDRRLRIEIGYGLEGVVPDAVAARVGRDVIVPRFREGRMEDGIVAGVDALLAAARGEEIPLERRPQRGPSADPVGAVMLCSMLGGFLGMLVAGRRRRVLGAVLGATLAGVGAWVLVASVPWAALAAAIGGAMGAGGAGHGAPGRARGGFGGGGFGGGGFGRGGFGGGGFGGGGGRGGGGGASGSW